MIVQADKRIQKSFKKFPIQDRIKIQELLRIMEKCNNFSEIKAEKLSGFDRYKLRVGNYRLILKKISETHVQITMIAHRRDIYKRLFGISF